LLKVALPFSLPALFVAIRISVPGAVTGALIVEWLATGRGIGNAIVVAVGDSEITAVWALAALISLVTLLLYELVGVIESFTLARLGFRS
jgi:ABC-type nitrate/sulfonate/bicarbonate transport system permease component